MNFRILCNLNILVFILFQMFYLDNVEAMSLNV